MPDASISIALASYDGERYLPEQLDSIARQSRRPDELVVSDDGSTDHTLTILEDFAARAPFDVKIVRHSENVGPWKNFERAVSYCSKDIIFLSDHDDVWRDDKIERMTQVLSTHRDAGGTFSNAAVVNADLTPRNYTLWDSCSLTPRLHAMFLAGEAFASLLDCHTIQASSFAFRASHLPMILPFSPRWPHDSWISIIVAACANIVPIDETLMKYRQHGSNLVGAPQPEQPAQYRKRLHKLRNLRSYYGGKRQLLDEALLQLEDLRLRIDAQSDRAQFLRPLAALALRRAKLERSRRKATSILAFLGDGLDQPEARKDG